MHSPGEWEMEHVPHSIYIRPLHTYDVWPENPNTPITPPFTNEINTFENWRIVPVSRPVINPPQFKEDYLDIPGTYGSLDYSRARTGLPIYGNRTGSWEFLVLNDYRSWEEAYSDIQHTIHGKRCVITLEDDLKHFYVGNLTLNEWRSDPGWSRIVINYNLEPYKYAKQQNIFNFEVAAGGSYELELNELLLGRAPVNPWIKCTPVSSEDSVNMLLIYTNPELYSTDSIDLSEGGKYIQIPEFILSNESGSNKINIFLYDAHTDVGETGFNIELLYRRGYM